MSPDPPDLTPPRWVWRDGVPFSLDYDDPYFSRAGGREETQYVFIRPNGLPQRWHRHAPFVIAESGFGSGLNFLMTWALWREQRAPATLHFISIERHPFCSAELAEIHQLWPDLAELSARLRALYPPRVGGTHRLELEPGRLYLTLLFGEISEMLATLIARVDAWYLDGFAPTRNAEMWSEALYSQLARLSAPDATLSTYSAAGAVRRALVSAGFAVERCPGFAGKREMLTGRRLETVENLRASPIQSHSGRWSERRAVVLGAGMAGSQVAYALALRGWEVSVIDRATQAAAGASGNHAGALMPLLTIDWSRPGRLHLAAYLMAIAQLERLFALRGSDDRAALAGERCGLLLLAHDERQSERQAGFRWDPPEPLLRRVDRQEGKELCGFTPTWDGLHLPGSGWVEPAALVRALLRHPKIETRFGCEVGAIERHQELWRVTNRQGGVIDQAPVVVVAVGGGVNEIDVPCGLPLALSLQSIRGQVSHLTTTEKSAALRCVVCYDGYITPAYQGLHLVGATFDRGDEERGPRAEDDLRNRAALGRALPDLYKAVGSLHGSRVAFRSATRDRLPLVGPVAAADGEPRGLYLSLAHGSRGLVTTPIAAELIASDIEGEPLPLPSDLIAMIDPARFVARDHRTQPK